MKKILAIIVLIAATVLPRLYKINRPLADWHSWRQVDTTSVTRNYVKNGINLLVPTYDDLSNIPSGLENPNGYRMVEFPILNALIASTHNIFSPALDLPIHVYSRLVSIDFSIGIVLVLFALVSRIYNPKTGFVAGLFYAFLPFNIFFNATTLPETPLLFFTVFALWQWVVYVDSNKKLSLLFFTISMAIALLIKPIAVFIAPAALYWLLKNQGLKSLKKPELYISALIILLPFILWRHWIQQYPEGIPASSWLFNKDNIRFKGAFFRWLFADRMGRQIFGFWGLIPFGIGLVNKVRPRSGWFFHWWLFGSLAYLSIFASGNVTHDYYQIFIIPSLVVFAAIGFGNLLESSFSRSRLISFVVGTVSILFMFAFSWYELLGNFNINNPAIVAAGQAADRLLPSAAKVIAPYGGDTAFLYQTNRPGWPVAGLVGQRVEQGATHYISTALTDETKALIDQCETIDQTPDYVIIDLISCSELGGQAE